MPLDFQKSWNFIFIVLVPKGVGNYLNDQVHKLIKGTYNSLVMCWLNIIGELAKVVPEYQNAFVKGCFVI